MKTTFTHMNDDLFLSFRICELSITAYRQLTNMCVPILREFSSSGDFMFVIKARPHVRCTIVLNTLVRDKLKSQ